MISGVKAVASASGGATIVLANAASGLRLPAIGVVTSNFVSGATAQVFFVGAMTVPSALDATWSGMANKPLWVGSGGMVTILSGLLSGMGYQKVGVAFSGGIMIMPSPTVLSGGYTTSVLAADLF